MNEPKRIQRKRTRGWKMPENTVYVGRPSKWGNPWKVSEMGDIAPYAMAMQNYWGWLLGYVKPPELESKRVWIREHLHELRGKNLACWCGEGMLCHADVLLELANQTEAPE